MRKCICILLILPGLFFNIYSQEVSYDQKAIMIDSAYDARIDRYVKRCFPEYTIHVKCKKDSFSLCSVETVLMVAPEISDDQIPVLQEFMTNLAIYYNTRGEHVFFDYGFVPGSVETLFDRMFNRVEIYVSSLEKVVTHSTAIDLISIFNKITLSYIKGKTAAGNQTY